MNTSAEPKKLAAKFVAWLKQHQSDRGLLADLRCALTPTRRPRAWPYLARFGVIGSDAFVIYETIGALFSHHPATSAEGNFGDTCRKLRGDHESFDLRFRRLLACENRDEACERIVPVVLAAKAKGVTVNYETLFADLWFWSDRVKTRWAQAYWGAPTPVAELAKQETAV